MTLQHSAPHGTDDLTSAETACRRRWKIYASIRETAWRDPTISNRDATRKAMEFFADAYLEKSKPRVWPK